MMNDNPAPVSGSISIQRNRELVLRENSLVTRGLRDIAQLDKTRAEELLKRGKAFFDNGDYDKAIADFTEAIRLDPKYAVAYNNRGSAYSSMGEFDKAIADYTEAIRLKPNDDIAYSLRASTYIKKGDRGKAKLDLEQAKRLGNGNG